MNVICHPKREKLMLKESSQYPSAKLCEESSKLLESPMVLPRDSAN